MNTSADILIVDDELANLELLHELLASHGYAVRAVRSGERALEAARSVRPDCVLLDVNMPGTDGYAICSAFQADPRLNSIPIIFLTAHGNTDHKLRGFAAGGRDYITKPFEVDEVLARLRNQLRIAELERDLRQQNEALNDANAKLIEASDQRARVTAMLVHDLRGPLTVIGAILDGVMDSESLQDGRLAYQGIRRMLDEMLALSRGESLTAHMPGSEVDVVETVMRAVRFAQHVAHQRSITLSHVAESQRLVVPGEVEQLDRVFSNLIGNALKFTEAGGSVLLRVSSQEGSGVEHGLRFVNVTVTDSGPGIAPEELPFVFDPYRQGKSAQDKGGVGLGLAIVARIVAAHGGRVRVLSQLGVGTEFHVLLPCKTFATAGSER